MSLRFFTIVAAKAITFEVSTGQVTGQAHQPTYVTPSFAAVLQQHLVLAAIPASEDNSTTICRGTCRGVLQAAEYEMKCVDETEFFNNTLGGNVGGNNIELDPSFTPTHDIPMTAREVMFRLALQGNLIG